ncbi:hypothetical protein LZK73_21450 [Neorhizobium galegae]|nr:hypothetical protein LZK73_21450 [Neorhizobium galegae]
MVENVDPQSGYTQDANALRKNKEHLKNLAETVEELVGETADDRIKFLNNLKPIMSDFGKESIPGESINKKCSYLFAEVKKPNTKWICKLLLAWLCVYEKSEAAEFYSAKGLADNALRYREYPCRPGEWGAKHPRKKSNADKAALLVEGGLGPVIPRDFATPLTIQPPRGFPASAAIRLPHPDGITFADISSCGRYIAVAGKAKEGIARVFVWDIQDISPATRSYVIGTGRDDARTVTFSRDDRYVIAAFENEAHLFYSNVLTAPAFTLRHTDKISYCSFSHGDKNSQDKTKIASASWDQTFSIWDVSGENEPIAIKLDLEGNHAVNSACFSPDNSEVVVASSDGSIAIWNILQRSKTKEFHFSGRNEGACGAQFSNDGKTILTAGPGDSSAHIWDTASGEHRFRLGGGRATKIWSGQLNSRLMRSPSLRRPKTAPL